MRNDLMGWLLICLHIWRHQSL